MSNSYAWSTIDYGSMEVMYLNCIHVKVDYMILPGEFGIVYKGHLTSGHKRPSAANPHTLAGIESVAVKTLKGKSMKLLL